MILVLAGFSYIEEREKNLELAGESVVKVSEQDGHRVVTVVEPWQHRRSQRTPARGAEDDV